MTPDTTPSLSSPLTDKQADVVRLIGQGLDYKHIAAMTGLSIAMIRDHATAAAKKMPKDYLTTKARILDWYRNATPNAA